jgi:hypothetical protein
MIKNLRFTLFCIGIFSGTLLSGHTYAKSLSDENKSVYTIEIGINQDGKERIAFVSTALTDGRAYPFEQGVTFPYISGITTTIAPDGSIQNDAITQKVFLGDRVLVSLGQASTSPSQFLTLDLDYVLSELISMDEIHEGNRVLQLPHVETFHHISNIVVGLDTTYKLGSIKKMNGSLVEISAKVHQEESSKELHK